MVTVTLKDKIGKLHNPAGFKRHRDTVDFSCNRQPTSFIAKPSVVVPVNGINGPPAELRMYTNAENLPSVINDPTQYVVLSREIGTNQRANSPFEKSGATNYENKPFGIYTDSATGTSYVSIAMRVEDQQFNKRLATQQSKEFNTFLRVDAVLRPEKHSIIHKKKIGQRASKPHSDHHHADRFSDRRGLESR